MALFWPVNATRGSMVTGKEAVSRGNEVTRDDRRKSPQREAAGNAFVSIPYG